MMNNLSPRRRGSFASTGDSLLAGAVVGASAQRHADHTAGERHKQRVMIPIQLQTQHPPVLPPHVASRNTEKHQLSRSDIFDFVSFLNQRCRRLAQSENYTESRLRIELRADRLHKLCSQKTKEDTERKKQQPLELYRVMQSVTIDQRVGGQGRSRQNTGRRRESKKGRKIPRKGRREKEMKRERKEEEQLRRQMTHLTCRGCRRPCPPGVGC